MFGRTSSGRFDGTCHPPTGPQSSTPSKAPQGEAGTALAPPWCPLVAKDEVFGYFKNHPQNRDHWPLVGAATLAGVVGGESTRLGAEAPL